MVSIRRIRDDEGPKFRAIRLQAIAESPRAFGSTLGETLTRPSEYWADRARSGAEGRENVLLVAEENGEWIGVVAGFVDDADPRRRVDIVSMWVSPTHRHRGVGMSLMESIVGWAHERGAHEVVLWVTENNAPAIRLYRAAGFKETGETQTLPSHPEFRECQMILRIS